MDPRTRSSLYEGAHGSPLYTAPRRNINPSANKAHIQEEIAEISRWVNHHLASAGHSDQLITDLATDMADGITLLQLVQTLAKEDLPKHFPNPMMRVQKLENLQMCVQSLQDRGVPIKGIHADDVASGNVKSILALCHALKRHFSTGNSPRVSTSVSSPPSEEPTTSLSPPPPPSSSSSLSGSGRLSFTSLDREDMALLGWLGDIVHRELTSYSMLYDGKVLCDFANELKDGAVSEQDIISGSPKERLRIAFTALDKHLFVRHTDIDVSRVGAGKEDVKIRRFLDGCRDVYRQKVARQQKGNGKAMAATDPIRRGTERRSNSDMSSMQEVFESLRSSSGSRTRSLEQKEKAKVEARSLEGIRQKRLSSSSRQQQQQGDGQKGQAPERETAERRSGRETEKAAPGSTHTQPSSSSVARLSSSTDNLSSSVSRAAKPSSSSSLSANKGTLHSSHDRLPASRRTQHNLPVNRPFSEIYVSGDPSFSSAGRQSGEDEHQQSQQRLNQSTELLRSPENWELDGGSDELSLSQPDSSAFMKQTHNLSSSLSPSHAASLGLSRSVDHSLGPLRQSSASFGSSVSRRSTDNQQSSTSSGRKSGHDSDRAKVKKPSAPTTTTTTTTTGGSSYTLPRMKKHSSPLSSPTSPPPPPLPTVPPPSSVTLHNQPTFVPPGGKLPRKFPLYPVPDSDNLASQISDIQDRIALLSNQLLHEKADVYTRLHRAVIRERKRRQATEKRLRDLETLARQLVCHYDNCFVQLAKEVGSLREEVARGHSSRTGEEPDENRSGTSLGNRLYMTKEIDQLKEKVSNLTGKLDIHSSQTSLPGSDRKQAKDALFMRKRANTDSHMHGPFMKGSQSTFKKLSKFFGEEPPRLEDIETFLEGLGYSHLYPTFSVHQISLAELYQMDASHLEVLGIPLGPRVRIMTELRKLQPLDKQSDSNN